MIEDILLCGFSKEDFASIDGALVFIKTFDELLSTIVAAKTSYIFEEVVYCAKFQMMYAENQDNSKTILDLDKLNVFYRVVLY